MIVPIKEELENIKEIREKYTPDFLYRSDKKEWRFTANDGEYHVWIKITNGFILIAVVETEYDFFLKDGILVGLLSDANEDVTNQEILEFFHWEDLEDIGGM